MADTCDFCDEMGAATLAPRTTMGGSMGEKLRECRFFPYRNGPWYKLEVFHSGRYAKRGTSLLNYRLTEYQNGTGEAIFEDGGFSPSPLYTDDGDETIYALMDFLTLQPGDTDTEFFDDYTERQMEYCVQHAHRLKCEVMYRFRHIEV